MKLRNKITGEIGELKQWWNKENRNINGVGVYVSPDKPLKQYNSLAELNDEWEDYEERKEYWLIDWTSSEGIGKFKESGDDVDIFNKSIDNYFETKEEAEKAVEKLKAWKRLKDGGFYFTIDVTTDGKYTHNFILRLNCTKEKINKTFTECEQYRKDLHLLFGGEE